MPREVNVFSSSKQLEGERTQPTKRMSPLKCSAQPTTPLNSGLLVVSPEPLKLNCL
jgi:hypothetical protein